MSNICPTCGAKSRENSRPSIVYRSARNTGFGDTVRPYQTDDFSSVTGWSMTNGIVLMSFANGSRCRVLASSRVAVMRSLDG